MSSWLQRTPFKMRCDILHFTRNGNAKAYRRLSDTSTHEAQSPKRLADTCRCAWSRRAPHVRGKWKLRHLCSPCVSLRSGGLSLKPTRPACLFCGRTPSAGRRILTASSARTLWRASKGLRVNRGDSGQAAASSIRTATGQRLGRARWSEVFSRHSRGRRRKLRRRNVDRSFLRSSRHRRMRRRKHFCRPRALYSRGEDRGWSS